MRRMLVVIALAAGCSSVGAAGPSRSCAAAWAAPGGVEVHAARTLLDCHGAADWRRGAARFRPVWLATHGDELAKWCGGMPDAAACTEP